MIVAFCINRGGLPGLGATMKSMLDNCSDLEQLEIVILESKLRRPDQQNIEKLCRENGYAKAVSFKSFDAEREFGHLRPLHGDWSAYARLLLPGLVDGDKLVYLDSDLLVGVDILEMGNIDFGNELLAAYSGSTLQHRIDCPLLEKLGCSRDMDYFNSGVLLLNAKRWREEEIDLRWRAFANQYPKELISHDQTILNYLCKGRFGRLPKRYNYGWFAHDNVAEPDNKIIHFLGSPKPWDPFGKWIHRGHSRWVRFQPRGWEKAYGISLFTPSSFSRLWMIRKSIARNIRRKTLI